MQYAKHFYENKYKQKAINLTVMLPMGTNGMKMENGDKKRIN